MARPQPFPWHALESCRHEDLQAWRRIKRWAQASLSPARCMVEIESVVGMRARFHLRKALRGGPGPHIDRPIAVEFETPGESGLRLRLEVEVGLATTLAARALKRPVPRLHFGSEDGDAESLAGSLAAILIAALRRAGADPLRVRAAGPSSRLGPFPREPAESFDTATFTVLVGDEAYLATVSTSRSVTNSGPPAWNRDRLRNLGQTPITIPIIACTVSTTPREVASLLEGDAWILQNAPTLRSLRGGVWLAAPDAEYGTRAELVDEGIIVLRGQREALGWSPMIEPETNDALLDAVGDVPIVVRVEVGTVRMTAREWADLVPGDVVEIGRNLGAPVTLRVSGVEVARGDLIEIEGQIGVRILSRSGEERAR